MNLDLTKVKTIYVIGIKGSGVVAVVEILHSMGIEITGSDTHEKFFTDAVLDRLGISYFETFDPKNIPTDVDLVIYSTAYNESNNVEFKQAKERGLLMKSYPEMVAYLFNQKYGIAVCGTHGKTTTSAMLATALKASGTDPSAIIGSKVIEWNGNALIGKGDYFVAETDEYQNKLRLYEPKIVVLTSVDFDHPDFFKDFEEYKKTFMDFAAKIPHHGFLAVWGDSVDTVLVAKSAKCAVGTYGFSEECDYKIFNFQFSPPAGGFNEFSNSNVQIPKIKQSFEIMYGDESLGVFEIQLTGRHNVLNAAAVVAVCHSLRMNMQKVKEGMASFKGTSRRFELIGEYNGAILIDDYAHHPEEIKATLKAAREVYPDKNIWAVFHPHTFTRTKALLSEFSQSFSDADNVIVLDIYGSAREAQGGVHSTELVELINKYDRGKAEYISTIDEAVDFLKDKIDSDDVVIALGAGNVWEVVGKLKEK